MGLGELRFTAADAWHSLRQAVVPRLHSELLHRKEGMNLGLEEWRLRVRAVYGQAREVAVSSRGRVPLGTKSVASPILVR